MADLLAKILTVLFQISIVDLNDSKKFKAKIRLDTEGYPEQQNLLVARTWGTEGM